MAQHRPAAISFNLTLSRSATAEALRTLRHLSRDAKTLGARIDAARTINLASSPPRHDISFRPKPDRRRANLPLGSQGERRRRR